MVSSSLASVVPINVNHVPLKSPQNKIDVQPPPPKGLKNVGNSCYANAALQCLLSTALSHALLDPRNSVIFRRYSSNHNLLKKGSGSVDSQDDLIYGEHGNDSSSDSCNASGAADDPVTLSRNEKRRKCREERMKRRRKELSQETCKWLSGELTDITRQYTALPTPPQQPTCNNHNSWSSFFFPSSCSSNASDRVLDPGRITRNVSKLSPTLKPYQQEDAHEFMRALLSTLTLDGFNRKLSSLFDGLLESAVTCQTCGHSSMTRDRYMDLSLDIASKKVSDLHSALKHFTKTELLDEDNRVHCAKCRTKRVVSKGLRLATAPTILVCHLKRFGYDCYGRITRLNKSISYPLQLEIGDYMSRANRGKPPPYELVGVLVHSGNSCFHGHYVAYVKSGKQWYKANDHEITPVDLHNVVLQQKAYILIYEVAGMRRKHGLENFSHYHHGKTPLPSSQPYLAGGPEQSHSRSWDPELDEIMTSPSLENDNNTSSRDLRHTQHDAYDFSLSPATSPTPSSDSSGKDVIINNTPVTKTMQPGPQCRSLNTTPRDEYPGATGNISTNSSSSYSIFQLFSSCGLSHTLDSMRESLFGEESNCCPSRSNSKDHNNIIEGNDTATTCTNDEEQNKVNNSSMLQTQPATPSQTFTNRGNENSWTKPQQALSIDYELEIPSDEASLTLDDIQSSPKIKSNSSNNTTARQQKYQKQQFALKRKGKLQEPLPIVTPAPPMRRSNTSSDLLETEIQAAKAYQYDDMSSREGSPAGRPESRFISPPKRFTKNINQNVNMRDHRRQSSSPFTRTVMNLNLPSSPQRSPKIMKEILRDYGGKRILRPRSRSRDPTKKDSRGLPLSPKRPRPPLSSSYSDNKPLRSKSAGPMRR